MPEELESEGDRGRGEIEKRRAAVGSVLAAVFLTVMKISVGLLTGSLGILAEAAHSSLDLVAAGVTVFAVRVSEHPADEDHPYGHGKVESLSALFETLLLLATCAWIVYEAVRRLFFETVEVDSSVWAFAVMATSIVVDYSRSRILMRAALKYNSQALEADALHFSTDIYSSSVVILGLFLVRASRWLGLSWLEKADAVAALGVSVIVVYIGVKLGTRTVNALSDGVPPGLPRRVAEAARLPGVLDVLRARVRYSGPQAFADVVLTVDKDTTLVASHALASQVEVAVRRVLPGADVVVHVEPGETSGGSPGES